ncbi:hypothetical protein Tco_0886973 [Tanacetum coccineum]
MTANRISSDPDRTWALQVTDIVWRSFLVGASFNIRTISSIPVDSSISPGGFLSSILLVVVIIVMVVIVAVILVVVVIVIVRVVIIVVFIGIVVIVVVSSIFKPLFVIIGFLHRITLYYLIHYLWAMLKACPPKFEVFTAVTFPSMF